VDKFTPSLDWSNEIVQSLIWIAKAWAISTALVLIALVLLARLTRWGGQFWVITGAYFEGRQSIPAWALLGVLLASNMVNVRFSVLLSYQSNDQYSALQTAVSDGDAAVRESGIRGFWFAMVTLVALIALYIGQQLLDIYLMQRFIIRWRVWLTHRLIGDWLTDRAYYRGRFIAAPIDNPDQRIQQDIDAFTASTGTGPNTPLMGTTQTLLFGSVNSIVSVVSFAPILWNLSGPLSLFDVTVPKALFWIVLLYVLLTTIFAFWLGHPLIRLSFRNELTNAAFRYALVRMREAAEAVGFYRGEADEQRTLSTRFAAVIANYRAFVRRSITLFGWNLAVNQIVDPLPLVIQAPRLFVGQISLGDVTQSASAFNAMSSSLSFFRSVYDSFANYRATIIRLYGLIQANEQARELTTLTTVPSVDGSVELDDVEVRSPSGVQLIDPIDMRLLPGESLVITGHSGSGKTTLLRSLAQLWPFTSGTVARPDGPGDTLFLSQLPYLPLGDLRAVLSYPAHEDYGDDRLRAVLDAVSLGHLAPRLGEDLDWATILSPGEQQRVAFARVLLTRPKAVFLDEATSALDEGQEFALYRLLRTELPDCILVSVSHRSTVERHHTRQLEVLGAGQWRLSAV
jgi:putative ATP-binding cassette transporter